MTDKGDAHLYFGLKVCVPFIFAAAAAAESPHCADLADATARLACYDAQSPPAPPPPEEPADISSVEGHIAGSLKGWESGTLFKLDNGQHWKIDGGGPAYYAGIPDNAQVVIERGYMGGYWMKIETVDRKVKVRRVTELRKR